MNKKLTFDTNKPVYVDVIAGNYEFYTHEENSVFIDAASVSDPGLVGNITDEGDRIVLSGQKLLSFLPSKDKILLKIYIPKNSVLRVNQKAGNLKIAGNYQAVYAENFAGSIKVDLNNFFVTGKAEFTVNAGDIKFRKPTNGTVELNNSSQRKFEFVVNGSGPISASVLLGDVKIKDDFSTF